MMSWEAGVKNKNAMQGVKWREAPQGLALGGQMAVPHIQRDAPGIFGKDAPRPPLCSGRSVRE